MTRPAILQISRNIFASLLLLVLVGCIEEDQAAEIPNPIAMTEEALGHYCAMNILEHKGPKAQIHLAGLQHPIWFSQIRDAIAFTRMPEETQEAVAVYVNDMGKTGNWDFPGDDTWIAIEDAHFVIGSTMIGGMGAPEAIPFGTEQDASSFVAKNGGNVVRLDGIPDAYVLGPVDLTAQIPTTTGTVQ